MFSCYHLLSVPFVHLLCFFFFFNDTATTEIYTLSLHDALPILSYSLPRIYTVSPVPVPSIPWTEHSRDRKSTRLNSSHQIISYAVFCLKKKKKIKRSITSAARYDHITEKNTMKRQLIVSVCRRS